jgi:hypothetical protein
MEVGQGPIGAVAPKGKYMRLLLCSVPVCETKFAESRNSESYLSYVKHVENCVSSTEVSSKINTGY